MGEKKMWCTPFGGWCKNFDQQELVSNCGTNENDICEFAVKGLFEHGENFLVGTIEGGTIVEVRIYKEKKVPGLFVGNRTMPDFVMSNGKISPVK